jgi:hypothetical protein
MYLKVARLYFSGVSQRRAALLLGINIKTVVRKYTLFAHFAERRRLKDNRNRLKNLGRVEAIQFDEMESFERSKCLPLSIPLAVIPGSRKVLGFRVVSMPAKGTLAAISLKKYGPRRDDRRTGAASLLRELKPFLSAEVEVSTDQNPNYPSWIRSELPKARHRAFKGKRGCVVGQGELKRVVFDPLFSFNHTAAMIRANVNRLIRRTWCTTKRPDRLAAHLELYIYFHNRVLTRAET